MGTPTIWSSGWLTYGTACSTGRRTQAAEARTALSALEPLGTDTNQFRIGRLKAIPEGNSNILNNSIALWSSEIAEGYKHSERSVPFVIAGTGGGAIKTGRYINPANDTMHQGLLLDILKGLGINKTQIGRSSENPPRFL